MKDTQPWISILIAIGYMVFKILANIEKRKSEPIYKPDWENEDNTETVLDEEEVEWPIKKVSKIPHHTKGIKTSNSNIPKITGHSSHNNESINNPTYPGIKKLLLSTQEQNPYKLYKMATSPPTKRPYQLLNKYSNARKAIIMTELLRRKT